MGCPYDHDPDYYAMIIGQDRDADLNERRDRALDKGAVNIKRCSDCIYVCAIYPRSRESRLRLLIERLKLISGELEKELKPDDC